MSFLDLKSRSSQALRSPSPKPILRRLDQESSEEEEEEEQEQEQEQQEDMDHNVSVNNEDQLARESDITVSNIKSSQAEYRGFTIYVLSSLVLFLYITWTLVPPATLHKLSIDYYPDKYWSIAIPSYSLMLMLFIYWFLALYNTEVLTLDLDDVNTFIDEHTQFPNESGRESNQVIKDYIHQAPSGVWDLPITLVNEVLYDDLDKSS
ncbi:GPI19 [Candida margitis]|uniref:GPI19 n=1 Tax=Candida margitis TaxID=1775924 RepID=UPI002227223C|nr:GPI19 [Candida margitis]KAI5969739.1 GPI19 [Candida margitis]